MTETFLKWLKDNEPTESQLLSYFEKHAFKKGIDFHLVAKEFNSEKNRFIVQNVLISKIFGFNYGDDFDSCIQKLADKFDLSDEFVSKNINLGIEPIYNKAGQKISDIFLLNMEKIENHFSDIVKNEQNLGKKQRSSIMNWVLKNNPTNVEVYNFLQKYAEENNIDYSNVAIEMNNSYFAIYSNSDILSSVFGFRMKDSCVSTLDLIAEELGIKYSTVYNEVEYGFIYPTNNVGKNNETGLCFFDYQKLRKKLRELKLTTPSKC